MASKSTRKPMQDDTRAAIEAVSLGMVNDIDRRDARRLELGLRQTIKLFQLNVSGRVGRGLTWNAVRVDFDFHFHYSPGTQDNDLTEPNFAWGVTELNQPVLVTCYVSGWLRDPDNDAIVGCRIAVGAMAPEATALTSFSGTMHFQFTGFASLFEDETEMQE